MAGLDLDPWQAFTLENALGERADGSWAAFEVGAVVSRQNGKGGILEARALAGLFLLGERLIIHSAHQFDTSLEAFRRLLVLIEDTPDFDRRVKRVSRSHGEEGIELKNGQRIRFRTRTKGGGRGFSSDCLILDEAMEISTSAHAALLPTLSARPNPQVWYTASAVDQWIHEHGLVLARVRERGIKGDDPALAYFEWAGANPGTDPEEVDVEDRDAWAAANPGLGIRISEDHVERELRSMDPRSFAVERLGVGDWPSIDGSSTQVISPAAYDETTDARSSAEDPVVLAIDISPDRSSAAIGAAGKRAGDDGLSHLEVIDHRRGTGWLVPRVKELCERHGPLAVVGDGIGPAAAFVLKLEEELLDTEVITVKTKEYVQACGLIYDGFEERSVRHLDTPELAAAVRGAAKRSLGDAWAWSRKNSSVDITPLVALSLALWRLLQPGGTSVYESRGLVTI